MGRVVVMNHVSLDGVIQGPGRADEDTRGGFSLGGWAISDDAAGQAWGERMAAGGGLSGWLFGRRTYDAVLGYWTEQTDSSFGPSLVEATKYVVSNTLTEPRWPNTTVLSGDVIGAVAEVKARADGVLAIMGSGQLIATLLRHDLIDEFLLMINPVVLGTGLRLFPPDVGPKQFSCTDATVTPRGLLIATYALQAPEEAEPTRG